MTQKSLIIVVLLIVWPLSAFTNPVNRTFTVNHAYFEPFVWNDENGISKGIYVDMIKEAVEKRMRLAVTFQYYPWKRAQRRVKTGFDDGFITLPTLERLQYTKAGKVPVAIATMGVFTYAGNPKIPELHKATQLSDLRKFQMMTYIGDGWAKEHLAEYKVDFGGNSLMSVLQKLALQRADILVQTSEVTLYNIKKLNLQEKITQIPEINIQKLGFVMLIGKKSPYLYIIDELDRTLIEMQKDGTTQKILSKYR